MHFPFMPLLLAPIVKNCEMLVGIYFIFLKEHPRPNLKDFQQQIWTSLKRSEKELSGMTKFSTFLQISCSDFILKLY